MVAEIAFPYNVLQEIFVNLNFSVFAILATIISSIACIEFMKKEAKRSKEKENAIHQYVTVSKCCISALIVIFLYKPSFEETLMRHIMPIFMIFVLCVIIWTIYASIKNIIQRKKNKQYNAMFLCIYGQLGLILNPLIILYFFFPGIGAPCFIAAHMVFFLLIAISYEGKYKNICLWYMIIFVLFIFLYITFDYNSYSNLNDILHYGQLTTR